jgi:hypothetical protein
LVGWRDVGVGGGIQWRGVLIKKGNDMLVSRRGFLKLISATIASGAIVPDFVKNRPPYVSEGEVVNYVGPRPGGFIGGQVVNKVEVWDGIGYPVQCWNNTCGSGRAIERYYDFDLANFIRDIPHRFWANPENAKYPNVHTWIRVQRFGETIAEAMRHLNYVGVAMPA